MDAKVLAARQADHGVFITPAWSAPCAIGRGGLAEPDCKREGDLKTPIAAMVLREVFFRPDRIGQPATALPVRALTPEDGWCDAPNDAAYNRWVRLPYRASAETLWREDHVYDVIVVLGWNDAPPTPGRGSAIFLHLRRADGVGTEGCIALEPEPLLAFLAAAREGDRIVVGQAAADPV